MIEALGGFLLLIALLFFIRWESGGPLWAILLLPFIILLGMCSNA